MPAEAYVRVLHAAVMTGVMPTYTESGTPTGEGIPLKAKERIDAAAYLIDKVLAPAKSKPDLAPPTIEAVAEHVERIGTLSTQQLIEMREAAMKYAEETPHDS